MFGSQISSGFSKSLVVALCFVSVWCGCCRGCSDYRTERCAYHSISINGRKVGYEILHMFSRDQVLTTDVLEVLYVNRSGHIVPMVTRQRYNETPGGAPLSFEVARKSSAQSVLYNGSIEAGRLSLFVTQNEKTVESCHKWDCDILFPAAFVRYQIGRGFEEPSRYVTKQYFPGLDLNKATEVEYTVLGCETIESGGRNVEAAKIESKISGFDSYRQYEWVDKQGNLLKSCSTVNGIRIEKTVCLKDEASRIDFVNVPDVFSLTVLPASAELKDASRIKRLVLAVPIGRQARIPESAGQVVRTRDDKSVIELFRSREPNEMLTTLDRNSPYRKANIFLDWHNPEIPAMSDKAKCLHDDSWSKAKCLTKYVHEVVRRKNLSVGFATASEVAVSLEGDCTEHAVLLAALLRASGLASRVVCGLQYVEKYGAKSDVWIFHMWTQVNIANQWYDLDGFSGQIGTNCNRIAMNESSLEDSDIFQLILPLLDVVRDDSIKVISVERAACSAVP